MIEPNAHYELYESRGREPDQDEQDSLRAEQDEQDWLRAEQETLKQERCKAPHPSTPMGLLESWRDSLGLLNLQGTGTSF
jgi:hypothetical protein